MLTCLTIAESHGRPDEAYRDGHSRKQCSPDPATAFSKIYKVKDASRIAYNERVVSTELGRARSSPHVVETVNLQSRMTCIPKAGLACNKT